MPLSAIADRREVHHRVIDMKTYARGNGLFDAEAHLVDRKPFDFTRAGATDTVLSRGRLVIEDGVFVGRKGAGSFLKRATR